MRGYTSQKAGIFAIFIEIRLKRAPHGPVNRLLLQEIQLYLPHGRGLTWSSDTLTRRDFVVTIAAAKQYILGGTQRLLPGGYTLKQQCVSAIPPLQKGVHFKMGGTLLYNSTLA